MPPAKGGGSGGLMILIGVAVLAVVAIGAFVVLGGGDSGSNPEDAVNDFVNAAKDRDCAELISLITTESFAGADRDQVLSECQSSFESGEGFISPGDTIDSVKTKSENGDTAVVTVVSTTDGEQSSDEITLRKQDGKWKIDMSALGATGTVDPGTDPSGDLPTDTSIEIPDISLPDDVSIPDFSDIPECDITSPDYDLDACMEAMGG